METTIIALITLAIVGIVVFGACFLAIFGKNLNFKLSKEKIEVSSEPNSDFQKND